MERKFEKEKREIQEQMNREILDLERQEERKYEQQLAQMKHELELEAKNTGNMLSVQVQEYKTELDQEASKILRDHQREQQGIIRKEEDRLDEDR